MTVFDLIESGLALVPIPKGQKAPTTKGWNLPEHAVTQTSAADRLIECNIGLAHAYCKPNPTCAIDVDQYQHAKAWLASHDVSLDHLLHKEDAVVLHSGKPQSIKLLYRLPEDAIALETKQILSPESSTSLEFRCATRCGKTVQDVLPPSIHPSGRVYKWVGKGNPLCMPVLPPALYELWLGLIRNDTATLNRSRHTVCRDQREESPRQVATIRNALRHIDADCEYEKWRNIVWAVLSTGWSCATDLALEWSESAPERFNDDAFQLLVSSYSSTHEEPITLGTLFHHAKEGGWSE